VQRALEPYRRELVAAAVATVRFETPPGKQLQVDFGEAVVTIAGQKVRVHFCVLTLGWCRRTFVAVWPCERQSQWLASMEGAFRHFGGVPHELLIDNARALVTTHDVVTREVVFNEVFAAFCRYWGVVPRACAPYRARTKGKDERAVQYVRRNAIAGHAFDSWEHFEAHLAWWMREVADVRVHGTTGERPIDRFLRDEAAALRPLPALPPFERRREVRRRVQVDATIEFDTNQYSVPWKFIRRSVEVVVEHGQVDIRCEGESVARHEAVRGKRLRVIDPRHLDGVVAAHRPAVAATAPLARPLAAYAEVAGGAW